MQRFGETLLIDADKNASALQWAEKGLLPFNVCNVEGSVKHIRKAEHVITDTKARPEKEARELLEMEELPIFKSTIYQYTVEV